MGLNGPFLVGTAEDHTLTESVGMIGTTNVSHIFHAEHGKLEVVLSSSQDDVNYTGVVAPLVHLAHGGNALVVEVEEAPRTIQFLNSNHAAGGYILDAHCNENKENRFLAGIYLP